MTTISKKLALAASAIALSAFIGGMLMPTSAEAGFGIKIPKIKVGTNNQGNNGGGTTTNAAQAPKGKNICGRVSYNNTGNYAPAAGFEVYLLHGNSFPRQNPNNKSQLLVDGPHMKLTTTDANGNYSAPIPANVNDYATRGKFPEVKLLFFKSGTSHVSQKRSVTYLGEFTKTENVSRWDVGVNPTEIVFVD